MNPVAAIIAVACFWQAPERREVRLPPDIVPNIARDVVKIAPGQYKLELDNQWMRVLRAKLAPGASVPMHDAEEGAFVALTRAHVRLIRLDKRMHYIDLEPGQVQWVVEDSYEVKNLSDKPVEFLFLEMKRTWRKRR